MRLLVPLLLLWGAAPAQAHSWYDGTCCSEKDCRPVKLGEVKLQGDGWLVVPTGELLPFNDIRLKHSRDPLMHRCLYVNGNTRCLYVATPGG